MMTARKHIGMALLAGAFTTGSAMAVPLTFELNDDGGQSGTLPASITITEGAGADALTLTLTGLSSGTVDNIREGGTGGQSGLGVATNGQSGGNFINGDQGEGFSFSFTDSSNAAIEVDILSLELTLFRASNGDSATLSSGMVTVPLAGGPNNNDFSIDLVPDLNVAAGGTATLLGGSGSEFRIHSITVEAIPEPGSLALIGLGGLMALGRGRRSV